MFSGEQVLAAEAPSSGQVVVALASGAVDLLAPQGDGLIVSAQLQAQGGTPALPSSIDVLKNASGSFDVLVSSQGSDTIYVYASQAAGAFTPGTFTPSGGVFPTTGVPSSATAGFSLNQAAFLLTSSSESSTTESSSTASTSSSSTAVSAAPGGGVSVGLSLGGFTSLVSTLVKGASVAILVAMEGNSYLNVPVLEFGFGYGEEASTGMGRMPELSAKYPIGDTSPLWRLIVGIDEALGDYRRSGESTLSGAFAPSHDPWSEDLFWPRLSGGSRVRAPDPVGRLKVQDAGAARDEPPRGSGLRDGGTTGQFSEPGRGDAGTPAPALLDRIGAGLKALASAALILIPSFACRARESRPDSPSRRAKR